MSRLHNLLEEERRKLNKLGEESVKKSIPLSDNPEVLAQSRRVDELVARYEDMKARRNRVAR
ncbi:aspartyl-phosphate phosphatase Spo0E family protein [Paenibacillus sp. NPDC058910]|uniref:aspartyl-phosphate phosphatase Spo0E family protein n=1 Tax=unclassified Paenibacillus TaxID=185978 RepID=UPI0036C0FA20